jgi:protein gp37
MSSNSPIEWTDATWNPVTGCTKISPGCKNCYAERLAFRLKKMGNPRYTNGFSVTLHSDVLELPLRWKKPKMIFVNSMSDLFQDGVPENYIVEVARIMVAAHRHVFQVLTKRSERMRDLLRGPLKFASDQNHIWWGVSVEDRKYGLPRIDHLRSAPAAVRFLSIEPLLEDLGSFDLSYIHWVIVGGESGPGARAIDQAWVESIQRKAALSGVPFFFKQWGGVNKKKTGRRLNGRTFNEMPLVR